MKNLKFIMLTWLILFSISFLTYAQQDYQIVHNFNAEYQQIQQYIKTADSLTQLTQLEDSISTLKKIFLDHKELLDKSLYPYDFNGAIANLDNALALRKKDFTKISTLQTQVIGLTVQIDTLNKRNSDLLDRIQLLEIQSEKDEKTIKKLKKNISNLIVSLHKRDGLIMSMLDSLMPPEIREKTGLSKVWIGMMLMASVTSLPELVTGISSVTIAGVPDIAIGDVIGSCVFNIFIIAILDAFYRIIPLSAKAQEGNILSAGFGIVLISMVSISIFAGKYISPLGWIGPYSLFFIIIYVIAIRLVYSYEKRHIAALIKEKAIELKYEKMTMKTAVVRYIQNALFVIVAAISLPMIGKGIAETTGLGQTFVGNVFIAFSTSLPEIVVSFSAVRIDAVDLAVGNLFGSNIFNILILALDDIFFFKGPLLSYAHPNHLISSLSAIAMTAIAIIGLMYRSQKKRLWLAWDSIGIILFYITNILFLFSLR